jgi:hypothetical protein
MLVASRLAGLSALEAYYAGLAALRKFGLSAVAALARLVLHR